MYCVAASSRVVGTSNSEPLLSAPRGRIQKPRPGTKRPHIHPAPLHSPHSQRTNPRDKTVAGGNKDILQVNLCQKHSFLNHLTHNMTTDCSLKYKFSTRKIQVQNMLCTKIVLNVKTKTKNNFCTNHVFVCSELVFFMY